MKKKCLNCGFTFWQGKTYNDTVLVLLIIFSFFAGIVAFFYGGFFSMIAYGNPMIPNLTFLLMGLIALIPVAYWITERREKCPRCNSKTWTYIEAE